MYKLRDIMHKKAFTGAETRVCDEEAGNGGDGALLTGKDWERLGMTENDWE